MTEIYDTDCPQCGSPHAHREESISIKSIDCFDCGYYEEQVHLSQDRVKQGTGSLKVMYQDGDITLDTFHSQVDWDQIVSQVSKDIAEGRVKGARVMRWNSDTGRCDTLLDHGQIERCM